MRVKHSLLHSLREKDGELATRDPRYGFWVRGTSHVAVPERSDAASYRPKSGLVDARGGGSSFVRRVGNGTCTDAPTGAA